MTLAQEAGPGAFILNKDAGPTSHDAVTKVKRLFKANRAGHTGTLDPFATGVLVVLIDGATRLASMLSGAQKEYIAVIELGVTTDSYDLTGKVTKRGDYSGVSEEIFDEALSGFTGTIEQLPPMFSAAKVDGKPLYKSARAGRVVERSPKTVEVYSAVLTRFEPPLATVELSCSAGTFIRAIANDLGEKLGCGAHLKELTRTRAGSFHIESASSVDDLEKSPQEALSGSYIKIRDLLPDYPEIELASDINEAAKHGIHPALTDVSPSEDAVIEPGKRFRLISPSGTLRAVAELKEDEGGEMFLRLLKVFKDEH